MKAEKIAVVICSALALPYVVFGQPSASPTDSSIDGDWVITFQAQGQRVSGNLHFKADGERVTGTVETAHTGPGTVQNGKWSQQKISATLVFEKHEAIFLEGELKGDGTLAGITTRKVAPTNGKRFARARTLRRECVSPAAAGRIALGKPASRLW